MSGHYEAERWVPQTDSVRDLSRYFDYTGPTVSLEEMDEAITEAVSEGDLQSKSS